MVNNQRPTVSIAMAVYNASTFINEQIDSIMPQLKEKDELIISYNESSDNTMMIINEYQKKDNRIKVFICENKGVVPNFDNALRHCTNQIIFLSDQDDVWFLNKLDKMIDSYLEGFICVMHGRQVTDSNLEVIGEITTRKCNSSITLNIVKNRFNGCCMAFDRSLLDKVLPLPTKVIHDGWIGIFACKYGKVKFIDEPLMYYRRHGSNASVMKRRKLNIIIKDRITIIYEYIKRLHYIKATKKSKNLSKI